jgi:hypothetical protein
MIYIIISFILGCVITYIIRYNYEKHAIEYTSERFLQYIEKREGTTKGILKFLEEEKE